MPDRQTPTECLIAAMEDIESVEDVFLIFRSTDEKGDQFISWMGNEIESADAVWLMEFVKQQMLTCVEEEEED